MTKLHFEILFICAATVASAAFLFVYWKAAVRWRWVEEVAVLAMMATIWLSVVVAIGVFWVICGLVHLLILGSFY